MRVLKIKEYGVEESYYKLTKKLDEKKKTNTETNRLVPTKMQVKKKIRILNPACSNKKNP